MEWIMLKNIQKWIVPIGCWMSLLLFIWTGSAYAHKVTAAGWVEGDTVFIESVFGGGSKPKNAEVKVFDPEGKLLLEGTTNENGEFQFQAPVRTTLTVVINAGMGHQATCKVLEEEFEEVSEDDAEEVEDAEETNSENLQSEGGVSSTGLQASGCPSEKAIRKIVASELSRQLKRMNRSGASDEGPSITDILGGVGYIIGLVGLGMYINYRRKIGEMT